VAVHPVWVQVGASNQAGAEAVPGVQEPLLEQAAGEASLMP